MPDTRPDAAHDDKTAREHLDEQTRNGLVDTQDEVEKRQETAEKPLDELKRIERYAER